MCVGCGRCKRGGRDGCVGVLGGGGCEGEEEECVCCVSLRGDRGKYFGVGVEERREALLSNYKKYIKQSKSQMSYHLSISYLITNLPSPPFPSSIFLLFSLTVWRPISMAAH